jgi:DNA-binding HxlR family transcriptional regulator
MPRAKKEHLPCSVARAVAIIGDRWRFLILRNVFYGIRRFEPLRASLGISRKVLSQRLAALSSAGVLDRRRYHDRPPRHEYRLTPAGVDLFPVLMALAHWGDRWLAKGGGAPVEFVHARCGHAARAQLVCPHCREPVGAHNIRLRRGPGLPDAAVQVFERAAARGVFLPSP